MKKDFPFFFFTEKIKKTKSNLTEGAQASHTIVCKPFSHMFANVLTLSLSFSVSFKNIQYAFSRVCIHMNAYTNRGNCNTMITVQNTIVSDRPSLDPRGHTQTHTLLTHYPAEIPVMPENQSEEWRGFSLFFLGQRR